MLWTCWLKKTSAGPAVSALSKLGFVQLGCENLPRDGDLAQPALCYAPNEEAFPNGHSELLQLQLVAFASWFTTCTDEKTFCACLCEVNLLF